MAVGIGIDIGGTFVDVVVADGNDLRVLKLPSADASAAAERIAPVLRRLVASSDGATPVERIAHGTTIATNALLERRWGRTALVTTKGFADVLAIGRQNRSRLYDLRFHRQPSVVAENLRFELPERVLADGSIHVSPEAEEIERVATAIRDAGVDTVAVCFLFSYLWPEHERRMGEKLAEIVDRPVTLSSDLHPEFREFERTSTTVINAALMPVVGSYLTELERAGSDLGVTCSWEIMQSSGEVLPASVAEREPARILLSGPAAGVKAACSVGEQIGRRDLISLDMGGTSCDVCLILEGQAARAHGGEIAGYTVALPRTDIHTVGAGGGSIAWVDAGGALRVGPRSAGAAPGPCCYGRGGIEPTVTDAHVLLGRIVAGAPLGGLPPLDEDASRRALARLGAKIGRTPEGAAMGVLDVAEAAMGRAIRFVTVERGHDPRELSLVAFGGAGPLHAIELARSLEIPEVVVPLAAGVLSAVGLLAAGTALELSLGVLRPVVDVGAEDLAARVEELWDRGVKTLGEECEAPDTEYRLRVDLRYRGQSHELTIPVLSRTGKPDLGVNGGADPLADAVDAFHDEHRRRYGHAEPDRGIELVAVRLTVSLTGSGLDLDDTRLAVSAGGGGALPPTAEVWFSGEPTRSRVVRRAELAPDANLRGPLLIVDEDTTIVVPPDCRGTIARGGHIVFEVR